MYVNMAYIDPMGKKAAGRMNIWQLRVALEGTRKFPWMYGVRKWATKNPLLLSIILVV